jgi:nitroreductase
MNTIDALKWRYAVKKFDPDRQLAPEDLDRLLDALILTPSSYGLQPWKFLVIEDAGLRAKLKEHTWNQPQVTDASALIVLCGIDYLNDGYVADFIDRIAKARGQSPDELSGFKVAVTSYVNGFRPDERREVVKREVYIALGNLLSAASQMGIDACPMGGFSPDKYDELLGLKEKGLFSVVLCPVGFRAADDKYAELPKVRFDKGDVVIRM